MLLTSTNRALALQDVSARDILEIQAMDEVAQRGGLEDNRLPRSPTVYDINSEWGAVVNEDIPLITGEGRAQMHGDR